MKVYLRKDLVKDLDTNALLTYVALRSMYHENEDEFYVSINSLCYRLFGNISYTRAFKDSIARGLSTLVERGMVVVKDKINSTEFIINAQGLYFKDCFFIGVDLEYIRMALACDSRVDRGSLVKYLLTVVGTICNDPKYFDDVQTRHMKGTIGFMPISYIAQESGISEQTACTYNTILEEQKILYIYRFNHTFYDDYYCQIRSMNNMYGLYEHKDNVLAYAKGAARKYGAKFNDGDANKRRSLAAKYNAMQKGKQYSEEETKEILAYVREKERYNGK
jgi:hypothetical protein